MSTLTSIALPVLLIGLAALVLPGLLTPRGTRSQRRLALSVLSSALVLLALGAVLFGLLYARGGSPVLVALREAPGPTLVFLLRRSALAALVWVPLLALSWLGLARRIETLRTRDGIRAADAAAEIGEATD
ncbi:hypothetical protein [Celeribacter indicus]|uniref:Uncharacterized protein n=1 Tax=Celeribacter indicus TaxID=1208324 RepID=A0A0B5DQY5_9RHOB|nr:hypothetical protein [Celeribacter indicus]AJE45504.1 hypothetical protein P73_0789 [Celeribacter indicus]SDW87323.1 hypothetical protein SAMN05443573_108146 [Celeribacter indicus]